MSKHRTIAILKGDKTLDVNKYFRQKADELLEFKRRFNTDTTTDIKFFHLKEQKLKQQTDMIQEMLVEMECNEHRPNYTISLIVAKEETA